MPSWSTPAHRPDRSPSTRKWNNSFYYLRTDASGADLPATSDSAARLGEMATYHTTHGQPHIKIKAYGTDDWNYLGGLFENGGYSLYASNYFVDTWPTGLAYSRPAWTLSGASAGATSYPPSPYNNLYFSNLRQEGARQAPDGSYTPSSLGDPTVDKHSILWSEASNELVESIFYSGTSAAAQNIVTWDLSTTTLPAGATDNVNPGVIAARIPLAPLLFTYQDLVDAGAAGDLGHMVGWIAYDYKNDYVWPSRWKDGELSNGIPNGSVIRLKSSFDTSSYSAPLKAFLNTLKRYGALLFDRNITQAAFATPNDPNWPTGGSDIGTLLGGALTFDQFDVVDMSSVAGSTDSIAVTSSPPPPSNVGPTASFDTDVTSGPAPLTIHFTDTSTDSDGTIASRAWDFDDGSTSTAASPSHTYTSGGTYLATLTVTDNDGASDYAEQLIEVDIVHAAFDTLGSQYSFALGEPIEVTSNGAYGYTSQSIDWGDGTVDTALPTSPNWSISDAHDYALAGTYTVTYTATNDTYGISDTATLELTIAETYSSTAGVAFLDPRDTYGAGEQVFLVLDFSTTDPTAYVSAKSLDWGDGTVDTETFTEDNHVYTTPGTYTISWTVDYAGGVDGATYTDTSTLTITIVDAYLTLTSKFCSDSPVGAESTVGSVAVGNNWSYLLTVTANAEAPDGDIAAWCQFAIDAELGAPNALYSEGEPGIQIAVGQPLGGSFEFSGWIDITEYVLEGNSVPGTPPGPGYPTLIDGVWTAAMPFPSLPLGGVVYYKISGTAQSPKIGATITAGPMWISLNWPYEDGDTATSSIDIYGPVGPENTGPTANFTYTILTSSLPYDVNFDGSGSNDLDGTIESYFWDFGDGTTATAAESAGNHTYDIPGAYLVTLTVTDNDGATDSLTRLVVLPDDPPAIDTRTGTPRRVAEITSRADRLAAVACGSGQWDEVVSKDYTGKPDTDFLHMNPVEHGIAVAPGERHIVSAYVKKKPGNGANTTASIGAAFFSPLTAASSYSQFLGEIGFSEGFSDGFSGLLAWEEAIALAQSRSSMESLGFSDGFGGGPVLLGGSVVDHQRGFLGYSALRLAGLNPEDFRVGALVLDAGDSDLSDNYPTPAGFKIAAFGFDDDKARFNGVYVGQSPDGVETARLLYADVQPRPGDLIYAGLVWNTLEEALSGAPPVATNSVYQVNSLYSDSSIAPTLLIAELGVDGEAVPESAYPASIKRLQMGDSSEVDPSWIRIEKEVVVPYGAQFLVPVLSMEPSSSGQSGSRSVWMTAAMVTRSQDLLTVVYEGD